MKTFKQAALALGLLLGGFAISQALDYSPLTAAEAKTKSDYVAEATAIIRNYRLQVISADSAPQVSQVSNEATTQLMYIQAKQNGEIIRLLTVLNNKR